MIRTRLLPFFILAVLFCLPLFFPSPSLAQGGLAGSFNCWWSVGYGCDINNSYGTYNCHPQSDYDANRRVCLDILDQSSCQSAINIPCAPPPTPTAGPSPTGGAGVTYNCDLTNHWCLAQPGSGGTYSNRTSCENACNVIYYACDTNNWSCSVSSTPTRFTGLTDCNTICRPQPANTYFCDIYFSSFPICRNTCIPNYTADCTYDYQGRCTSPGSPVPCNPPPPPTPPPPPFCDPTNPLAGIFTAFGCLPPDTRPLAARVLSWSVSIAGLIAFLTALYAVFLIVTSSGDPKKVKAGQELFTASVAGLILIILSVVILNFLGVTILNLPSFVGNPRLQ